MTTHDTGTAVWPAYTNLITADHRQSFERDGYCVLEAALPGDLVALLEEECDRAMTIVDAKMDELGTDVIGGSRRGIQYSPGNCRDEQPRLEEFLFGELMEAVREGLIGPGSSLLWEQYSVKLGSASPKEGAAVFKEADGNPQSLGSFSWHQDSGYVPHDHPPYLTCWVALDDTTEENGALYVLPFSQIGIRTRVTHEPHPLNGDLVGYFGSESGTMVPVPRGSLVCFSSTLFHRSGRNSTDSPRRAYLAQYRPAEKYDMNSGKG